MAIDEARDKVCLNIRQHIYGQKTMHVGCKPTDNSNQEHWKCKTSQVYTGCVTKFYTISILVGHVVSVKKSCCFATTMKGNFTPLSIFSVLVEGLFCVHILLGEIDKKVEQKRAKILMHLRSSRSFRCYFDSAKRAIQVIFYQNRNKRLWRSK